MELREAPAAGGRRGRRLGRRRDLMQGQGVYGASGLGNGWKVMHLA